MQENNGRERRKHSNPIHVVEKEEEDEEEEDEEALSLSDLPANEENQVVSRKEATLPIIHNSQEEFNFCSSLGADSLSKESEMCVADDVFFQGQLLPLRHSVSSESGSIVKSQNDSRTTSRCHSRSESMDRCYSVGFTSLSSRSSSINSHHSSSSGTTSSTTTTTATGSIINNPRPKTRNQFQFSHPSPKPQVRPSSTLRSGINVNTSNRKSALWSIFRVGLVTAPEIAIQDLKFRNNSKNTSSGNRNGTSTIGSTTFGNYRGGGVRGGEKNNIEKKEKFFDKNGVVIFNSCKCSSNAVAEPIPPRVAANATRRSASVNEAHAKEEEMKKLTRTAKQHDQRQAGKQGLSRHRTFEWLKQLSVEAPAVIDEA